MKLNLGCETKLSGYVNLDITRRGDVQADAEHNLPFKDGVFDDVIASHILEHIHNLTGLQRELARVVKPGGMLVVTVPYYLSPDAWGDPTHCRAFSVQSFQNTWWCGFCLVKLELQGGIKAFHCEEFQWLVATFRRENGANRHLQPSNQLNEIDGGFIQ